MRYENALEAAKGLHAHVEARLRGRVLHGARRRALLRLGHSLPIHPDDTVRTRVRWNAEREEIEIEHVEQPAPATAHRLKESADACR